MTEIQPELSFLLEIFLLPPGSNLLRDKLVDRMRLVELQLRQTITPMRVIPQPQPLVGGVPQAPSTIAAMARHDNLMPLNVTPPPEPVAVIAQTPAAAAALESRAAAMAGQNKGMYKAKPK